MSAPPEFTRETPPVESIISAEDIGAAPPLRLLPALTEPEPLWKRWLFCLIALFITAGFFYTIKSFWAPAPGRPGIDENAYLVSGKNIAQHGTIGFRPTDNYQFVGAMWVRAKPATTQLDADLDPGRYYPKYPAGLPLLNAVALWIGAIAHTRDWVFLVSPICATVALFGMFLLTRALAGSFYGLLAMIVLATGITTLQMADIPNSHAPALCFVVWGMFLILRWWQTGSRWRGISGGFLLGYAVTIRYSEALLLFPLYSLDRVLHDTSLPGNHPHWWMAIRVLRFLPIGPLGFAVMLAWNRSRSLRSLLTAALPIIGWAVPVSILLAYNWLSFRHLTAYDLTRESEGFSSAEFLNKWDFTVQELYLFGLFLFFPLGLAGLAVLFRRSRRVGLFLVMWFLPGALLYNAYYWGGQIPGVGFLRFFLTLFPPLIIAAMVLLKYASAGAFRGSTDASQTGASRKSGAIAMPIGAGILTAATALVGISVSLPELERQHRGNMNLVYSARIAMSRMKTKINGRPVVPVAFADAGLFPQLLQYMQFVNDCDWYAADAFRVRVGGGFGFLATGQRNQDNPDAPLLLQQDRIDLMMRFLANKTPADLRADQRQIVDRALAAGRPVYAILTADQLTDYKSRFQSGYELVKLDRWDEPCNVKLDDRSPANASSNGPMTIPHPLAPPVWIGEPAIRWHPQELYLMEIRSVSVSST